MPHLGLVSLLVGDYDNAIAFYTRKMGFDLIEDTDMGDGKRWVIIAPPGATETRLLLAQASNAAQKAAIGNQTGGRVGFFLNTDDFARDHTRMQVAGVEFLETPRHETYGTVAVFRDLYGNKWDLLELAKSGQ
ncbi:VOC family protein [Thalassospira sp.]|uniref:VOC family protein n=1 Tax=Thalassospira sp. TaxID=1912094 RepID=UPI00273333A9|nr:VOC family protein [Thalassospira sp.]MDP2698382.1 VOC family protein [Thalassospira sp.]